MTVSYVCVQRKLANSYLAMCVLSHIILWNVSSHSFGYWLQLHEFRSYVILYYLSVSRYFHFAKRHHFVWSLDGVSLRYHKNSRKNSPHRLHSVVSNRGQCEGKPTTEHYTIDSHSIEFMASIRPSQQDTTLVYFLAITGDFHPPFVVDSGAEMFARCSLFIFISSFVYWMNEYLWKKLSRHCGDIHRAIGKWILHQNLHFHKYAAGIQGLRAGCENILPCLRDVFDKLVGWRVDWWHCGRQLYPLRALFRSSDFIHCQRLICRHSDDLWHSIWRPQMIYGNFRVCETSHITHEHCV